MSGTALDTGLEGGPLFANAMSGDRPLGATPITEGVAPTPENRARIEAAMREVDLDKPESLILWGSGVQRRLGELSTQLIGATRAKDAGPAGAALSELVLKIKGFRVDDIKASETGVSRLARLWRRAVLPIAVAMQRFETVRNQVNLVVRALDRHIGELMRDLVALERLYAENAKAYETIKVYVDAGTLLVREIDAVRLPALKAAIREDDPLSSERYARLERFRQRLERRVTDLALTRTALFQGLPAIALIEDNDVNLIERIQSTIANAVPLWDRQIALLLADRRGADAARGQRDAADLTNELLEQTAKQLRSTNKAVRVEVERGLFDADRLQAANAQIVGALEDAREIYENAVERRKRDLEVAEQCERELQAAMGNAK